MKVLAIGLFISQAFYCVSGASLKFTAQGRVTENDIVKLHDSVSDLSPDDRQPVLINITETPLAIQPTAWSFTLADAILLAYASTNDRDVALQQITQIWEDALAPLVTDVQVVLVDDQPDLTNPTDFADNTTASIVTYAVLGNSPTTVDLRDAKEKFRTLLGFTRIPVIPVNITQDGNLFAFLESIGLTYTDETQRDELLQSIKDIWISLLGPIASNIQLTLYNEAAASSGTVSKHYVTYIISGNSTVRLNAKDFEQSFRRLLLDSHLVGHGVWGISIPDPVLINLPDTSLPTAPSTTVRRSSTEYTAPSEPFEITDSVILPYDNAAQVNQLLQQIKQFWITILGPRFVFRDIRFVNSTLQNITVSGVVTLVYDITYEMSGLTDIKLDVEDFRAKFHREALRVLAPDGTVSVAIVQSNIETTVEPTTTTTEISTSVTSPVPSTSTPSTEAAIIVSGTVPDEKEFIIVSSDLLTTAPSTVSTKVFVPTTSTETTDTTTEVTTTREALTAPSTISTTAGTTVQLTTKPERTKTSTGQSTTRTFVSSGFVTRWVILPGLMMAKSQAKPNGTEPTVAESSKTESTISTEAPIIVSSPGSTTTDVTTTTTTATPTTTFTIPVTTLTTRRTSTTTRSTSTTPRPTTRTSTTSSTTTTSATTTRRTSTSTSALTTTTTSTTPLTTRATTTVFRGTTRPTPSTRIIFFTTASKKPTGSTIPGTSQAVLQAKQGVVTQGPTTRSTTQATIATTRRRNGSSELDTLATLTAEKLIRETLANSGFAQVHSAVFFENIMLQLSNGTTIQNAMDDLRLIWVDAFGNDTEDVKLAVYHNTTIKPANVSEISVTNIDYVVLVLGKVPNINVEAARIRFMQLLANNTRTLDLLTRKTASTTARPNVHDDSQVHNNVILDSVSISAAASPEEREQLLKAIQIIWKGVVGSQAQDVQVSVYREASHAPLGPVAGNEQLIDLFYIVLVKSKISLELDVDALRIKADRLVSSISVSGVTILANPEHVQFVHEAASNTKSSSNFTALKSDAAGPLLGFALPNTVLLNYSTEAERSAAFESILNVWKEVFGFNRVDVRIVVSNDSVIDVDGSAGTSGSKVHYVTYTVFVITNTTNYDQEKIIADFNLRLEKANLPSVILDTRENSATELVTQRVEKPSNTVSAPLKTIQPDSVESYVFDNVILANYSSDLERDAVFEALTKMWIDFLGTNALDVQIRPYLDIMNSTTGFHRLSYAVIVLSRQRGWNIDIIKNAFREYLSGTNHSETINLASPAESVSDRREDLIIIPAGLSLSYSSPQELANMLLVIQNLWQRILDANATSVDITLYSDIVNHDLSSDVKVASSKEIHDISYVVIVQTNQSNLNIPFLKGQFEQLLPGMLISNMENWRSSQPSHILTNFDYLTNSFNGVTTVRLTPALVSPPLPSGLIIHDYIWLVYNNTEERDQYLRLMRSTWDRILSDHNATNITLVFDREETQNSAKDTPPDSHKVFYNILAVLPAGQSVNSTVARRRFRYELPHENFLFGFDMEDEENN